MQNKKRMREVAVRRLDREIENSDLWLEDEGRERFCLVFRERSVSKTTDPILWLSSISLCSFSLYSVTPSLVRDSYIVVLI